MRVTYYASSNYVVEVDEETTIIRKTYTAGSTSIAVRTIIGEEDTLNWLLSDHLGSSSITTNADGSWNSEIRYSAFGETRYSSGITPTDYRYTGQLEQADVNLYYYNARYYDAALGRFIQADTIIPGAGNSKSFDRYAYVSNNPVIYTDPSGHGQDGGIGDPTCGPNNEKCFTIWDTTPNIIDRNTWGKDRLAGTAVARSDGWIEEPGASDGYLVYLEPYDPLIRSLNQLLDTIVFHHLGNSDIPDDYSPFDLLSWEMDNGEYDLDYHFIIMKDGTILEGRDINARGAHVDSGNTGKIGILFFSNHDVNDDELTKEQIAAATDLTLFLYYRYKTNSVVGHRDINPDICPGDLAMPTVLDLNTLVKNENIERAD